MRITYLKHSGFSIDTGDMVIMIDCISPIEKPAKPSLVLVSHAHSDHRSEEALAAGDCAIDCPAVGKKFEWNGATVRTFGSTDEGVSFLIEVAGKRIFHAGDFNLWHWKGENDIAWTRQATQDFYDILDTLPVGPLDAAMFPVDPRMGEGYDEGAEVFNGRFNPKIFIPMHFWNNPEAATEFAKKYTNVRPLTEPGQHMDI